MKGKIARPLRDAFMLQTPAVAAHLSADEYIALLYEAAGVVRTARVAIGIFQRWIRSRQPGDKPIAVSEGLLERVKSDMETGVLKPVRTRQPYGTSAQEIPLRIAALHNALVGRDKRILRRLVDMRSLDRYRFFLTLTSVTQKAILWFEEAGIRASRSRMGGLPLTVVTRRTAVTEALSLLRRLDLKGLEHVTEEHVLSLVPKSGPEDPQYRRIVHMLNAMKTFFRACMERGLLHANPAAVIPHSAFSEYGVRDFLPQDGLARIRDIEADAKALRDPKRFADRVVMLLLVDTAMRRGELASLARDQVRRSSGGYEIELRPQNQKGADKPAVILPILYPETTKLLTAYLRWRDAVAGPKDTALILNRRRQAACDEVIAKTVRREGRILGLRTYYKERPPTPHDLRRTFAMCNAAPLGLNMQAHELADRLRDSIEVTFKHYCRNNPLIASERAQVYRGRLNGKCSLEEALTMVDKLAGLGVRRDTIAVLRKEVRRATAPVQTAEIVREWIAEEEGMQLIRREWGRVPAQRKVRDYLRNKGGVRRGLSRGALQYDATSLRAMLDGYVLLSSLPVLARPAQRAILADPEVIRMGWARLVPKKTALSLLVDAGKAGLTENSTDAKLSKTGGGIEQNWRTGEPVRGRPNAVSTNTDGPLLAVG